MNSRVAWAQMYYSMDTAAYCQILAGTLPLSCIRLCGCVCSDREAGGRTRVTGLIAILSCEVLREIPQ